MSSKRHHYRIITLAFIESFAAILLERGFYFYTANTLKFSELHNLFLALIFGIAYIIGALVSHRTAKTFTEKRSFIAALCILLFCNSLIAINPTPVLISICFTIIGFATGLKWPIVESYVSAGQSPQKMFKTVGIFSLAWAGAVPVALAASGVLIGSRSPQLFFWSAALVHLSSIVLCKPLIRRPIHLPDDHPERLPESDFSRYKHLLAANRSLMVLSYIMLFLLAPLLPTIFQNLQFNVQSSAALSGMLDAMRFLTFFILGIIVGWHGKSSPIIIVAFALIIGFIMILSGDHILLVIGGELLFGFAAGMVYYGSLYYALAIKNAAVNAGGAHEGLIGSGFAIGPLIGIIGIHLSSTIDYIPSIFLCTSPFILLSLIAMMYHLYHLKHVVKCS